ncbi:nucleotidyltransferase family protein [Silvimonas iriomotensis]|uniref:Nitrate reductase n=1 Tax=Silvimonas iriomotensis TaxID=449662 RepID=A0ABQ2PBW3_9NEIS|nr:nucleotidyltransferase family protein [Silvimonas iriomotensis]GGP22836.1 nitrate reductase [Silvimonas iriomotensis]
MVSQLQPNESLEARLRSMVQADAQLLALLACVRAIGLKDWCIAAGAVRNRVWQQLHGQTSLCQPNDVDVCYFDADLPPDHARQVQAALAAAQPEVHWDVVNQAWAHLFNGLAAVGSLAQGLASRPETATAVGVWLDETGQVQVLAPLGLDDLFGLQLRRNPAFANEDVFRQRLTQKQWQRHWPLLTLQD